MVKPTKVFTKQGFDRLSPQVVELVETVMTNMSKIQSESNSQNRVVVELVETIVIDMSKIQSESNSQCIIVEAPAS